MESQRQPSANLLTLRLRRDLAGRAVRGEPQIVDCAAVIALSGRWRTSSQAVGNARRGAGLVMSISSSSRVVLSRHGWLLRS
jgi:hypothetical protein